MSCGSHWSMGPSTSSVVRRVARSVSGRVEVVVLGAWPLRACAACFCSCVACISAKVLSLLGCEGRYFSLNGAVVGSRSHASVRQSTQVCAVALVVSTASLGLTSTMLSMRCCAVVMPCGVVRSSSFVLVSAIMLGSPTNGWKCESCVRRKCIIAWFCSWVCSLKCSLMLVRGCAGWFPRLGLGLSMASMPGSWSDCSILYTSHLNESWKSSKKVRW